MSKRRSSTTVVTNCCIKEPLYYQIPKGTRLKVIEKNYSSCVVSVDGKFVRPVQEKPISIELSNDFFK